MSTAKAMIARVGAEPEEIILRSDERGIFLDALQAAVDGDIEMTPPIPALGDDMAVFCCDVGKLEPGRYPPNRKVSYRGGIADVLYGDIVIAALNPEEDWEDENGPEFRDLDPGQIDRIMSVFGGQEAIDAGLNHVIGINLRNTP